MIPSAEEAPLDAGVLPLQLCHFQPHATHRLLSFYAVTMCVCADAKHANDSPVQKKPHWTPGYCRCSWAISSLKCFTARAAKYRSRLAFLHTSRSAAKLLRLVSTVPRKTKTAAATYSTDRVWVGYRAWLEYRIWVGYRSLSRVQSLARV